MALRNEDLSWSTLISTGMFLVVIVGAFWALAFGPIQDKFLTNEKRDVELREEIKRINAELLARRLEFVGHAEFLQFQLRFDQIAARILSIEQTRPTTGELSAISKGAELSLSQMEQRIRALEVTTTRFNQTPRP
jgi:hypothetical protein